VENALSSRYYERAIAGSNAIEIRVTNLWVNRLIGDVQPGGADKVTFTVFPPYTAVTAVWPSRPGADHHLHALTRNIRARPRPTLPAAPLYVCPINTELDSRLEA
jgi:hypothetical protein